MASRENQNHSTGLINVEPITADLAEAERFLALLAPQQPITFQTFSDRGKGCGGLARILHGTLHEYGMALQDLNRNGAGVFAMVNAGDGAGRKTSNVQQVRALFVDLDGSPIAPVLAVPLKPHLVIESSSGRFHAYWLICDCPLDRFNPLQTALADKFGSDPAVKDLPRVMRIPGFWHQKGEPFQTRILSSHAGDPYLLAQAIEELELSEAVHTTVSRLPTVHNGKPIAETPSSRIGAGSRNTTLTSLAGSMRRRGMGFDGILSALLNENETRCTPPLPRDEVHRIANSIIRYSPDVATNESNYTRAELAALIDSADDFDLLTDRIAKLIATGDLRETEREQLYKRIAKKTNVSSASLRKDAKTFQHVNATRDLDHISAAREVIKSFGDGNLLHAHGYLWAWRGDGIWRRIDDRETKKSIHTVAASNELTAHVVGSILDLVKTEAHRPGHRFDQKPESINCANGELIYQNGDWLLLPHNREHYRTTMIPVTYDPSAQAPRFCRFLEEIFEGEIDREDRIKVVHEALGYTLTTSCHLEKFFLLIGSGANGKSVLLDVVAALVGREHTCAVQPSQFENRFQRGHLQGRLANIITEIAEGSEIADAQLKALVSGEMTTAEHKHKDPFDFIAYAKHWFGTNHLPHTRDFSDALFRRAIVLTFNNKFEGSRRDVNLVDTLKAELPGILNLALEGLHRLRNHRAFSEIRSSAEVASRWRMEIDPVAQFISDECEAGPSYRTTSAELFIRYQSWTVAAGARQSLSRNKLTERLNRIGYEQGRGTGGTRMIEGIRPRGFSANHGSGDAENSE